MSWVWKYALWHLTSKTWLIRANRNHACNIGGSRAPNIWFKMTFRLCCVLDGEQEYLNRNLECIHCMCFLVWPMGFLTSSLQEGLYQNLGLIFFYYTEEPLCCLISQIEHISARVLQFCLCWLPKGEKPHTIKNIFVFVWISRLLEEYILSPFTRSGRTISLTKTRFFSWSKQAMLLFCFWWPDTNPCIRG